VASAARKKKARRASPKPGAKPSRRGKPRANSRARKATRARASARPSKAPKRAPEPAAKRTPKRAKKTVARAKRAKKKPVARAKRTKKPSARPKRAIAAMSAAKSPAKSPVKRATIRKAKPHVNAPATAPRTPSTVATPVPPAFSVQRAGASAREQLLFELQRARAAVKAASQGLTPGHAEKPIAPGKWSIKEIVLHLSERDRVRLEEFGRTLGGQPRSWADATHEQENEINEIHLAPLRAHTWDEAVRRMDSLREQLLWRLSQLPSQPDDVWRRGHAFGDMMWALPQHDRLHAEQIKLARLGELVPVED
jgi:uncharacterized damage-inducible protein DinB